MLSISRWKNECCYMQHAGEQNSIQHRINKHGERFRQQKYRTSDKKNPSPNMVTTAGSNGMCQHGEKEHVPCTEQRWSPLTSSEQQASTLSIKAQVPGACCEFNRSSTACGREVEIHYRWICTSLATLCQGQIFLQFHGHEVHRNCHVSRTRHPDKPCLSWWKQLI